MAFKAGFKTRVLNGDFSLSAKATSVSLPLSIDMLDTTTLADTAKRFVAGAESSTFSVEGFIDVDTATDNAAWTASQPFTYGQEGLTIGDPVVMVTALRSSYELGSPVAGVSSFTLGGTTDGRTDFGRVLHDLTAVTTTENGTAYDYGASSSAGAVAHLHVTAYSVATSAVFTVQDSADGSTGWATIGTFATVTGVTSEAITITGTVRRYLRYVATLTGAGSVTFAIAAARR